MNRLQKKCLIAVAGTHLFLLVALLCSGFIRPHPKADDLQTLDVIPANAVDAALTSGVKGAQAPPPAPVVNTPPPQPQPIPLPPQVQPVVPPPPAPAPSLMNEIKDFFKPEPQKLSPDELKPTEQTAKPKEHKIDVSLKPVVHNSSTDSNAKAEKHQNERERNRVQNVLSNLKNKLSSATEINLPGSSSVAYANYGAIVVSIYHNAFRQPDNMNSANATVTFTVTIARDGHVISSEIVTPSGDSNIDNAVQRLLDRVTFIEPFPEGSSDSQRTYSIDFDANRTSLQ